DSFCGLNSCDSGVVGGLGVFEGKLDVSQPQRLTRLHQGFGDPLAFDEGAIGRAQVANEKIPIPIERHLAVPARHARISNLVVIALRPTNAQGAFTQEQSRGRSVTALYPKECHSRFHTRGSSASRMQSNALNDS